ncbi:hypothetical protein DPEC_G00029630 [Dallia pectoralis]|uniref:Uncharacterized protein n=1 Tax=Dallia pectoralis TaxID=75939 RepID=A0ACC2HJW6_DALPE|nr:hypothetical protein DPEC_G00029630 [Dallia pectoralis]
MKSPGKHHAISAYLQTPFTFTHPHPLCLQYEVRFGKGVECSGGYIKLLTQTNELRLSQFSESTPYSVMFGPDKCGKVHRLHLIIRVTDPSNGRYRDTPAPQPDKDLASYFTDRQSHLYTLHLYADTRYEIFIDQSLVSHGRLLTDEQTLSGLRVGPVGALGLELFSFSGEVTFDNFLLTEDLKQAERWTQNTWGQKQPGRFERLLIATNSRPWLWGVYVFTVGLPIILFISYMWPDKRFGPPDQDYYYKKSDDPQPDGQSETVWPNGQSETDQPISQPGSPTIFAGATSRTRRREVQKKSDLEMKTGGHGFETS